MCVEFPSQVVAVDDQGATVDREGRQRRASTILMPDAAPGDWVYVAAGAIVKRLDPLEAQRIRSMLLTALEQAPLDPTDSAAPLIGAGNGGSR